MLQLPIFSIFALYGSLILQNMGVARMLMVWTPGARQSLCRFVDKLGWYGKGYAYRQKNKISTCTETHLFCLTVGVRDLDTFLKCFTKILCYLEIVTALKKPVRLAKQSYILFRTVLDDFWVRTS